jgi:hypothetical protein
MTLPEFPEPVSTETDANAAQKRRPALKFEPMLVPQLRTAQAALQARFADLAGAIRRQPATTGQAIEDCSRQFSAVRHIESASLYPLLARAVEADPVARGQLAELRLIGMMLARVVMRRFDELLQAVRAEVYVVDSTAHVAQSLERYARHCELVVYPLYEVIGEQREDAVRVA